MRLRATILAAVTAAALCAQASAAELPRNLPLSFGGPFSLVDHNGVSRTDRDFRGNFLLVYFGYTYCPDICPTGLQTIAEALDSLGPRASRVRPVFVSVDPARDTPAVLKDYVANFHPTMVGLTGTEAQIRAAARAYRIHRSKVITPDMKDDKDYLVTHSSITYLMGPDGSWKTLFPHGTTSAAMAMALRRYLN